MSPIEEAKIDAGAKALREHQMSGRFTIAWETLPKSAKRKWVIAAHKVLDAAYQGQIAFLAREHVS